MHFFFFRSSSINILLMSFDVHQSYSAFVLDTKKKQKLKKIAIENRKIPFWGTDWQTPINETPPSFSHSLSLSRSQFLLALSLIVWSFRQTVTISFLNFSFRFFLDYQKKGKEWKMTLYSWVVDSRVEKSSTISKKVGEINRVERK